MPILYDVTNRAAGPETAALGAFQTGTPRDRPAIVLPQPPDGGWLEVEFAFQAQIQNVVFPQSRGIWSQHATECAIVGVAYRENHTWVRASMVHVPGGNPHADFVRNWPDLTQNMPNRKARYGVVAFSRRYIPKDFDETLVKHVMEMEIDNLIVYVANWGVVTLGISNAGNWGEDPRP